MTEFDYIIAGAGTAGCVLAARLTQNVGTPVLLLEAGGPARTRALAVPDAWPELLGTEADWADATTAQADAGPVAYPRGQVLGGSGAINAMAHLRGHRAVYDGWAAAGAVGWGFADLLPYFRRGEHAGAGTRCCAAPRPGLDPAHGRQLLPPCRHLPHGVRPGRGRRHRPAGPRDHRAAYSRRVGDPGHLQRPVNATVLAIAEKAAAMISGR